VRAVRTGLTPGGSPQRTMTISGKNYSVAVGPAHGQVRARPKAPAPLCSIDPESPPPARRAVRQRLCSAGWWQMAIEGADYTHTIGSANYRRGAALAPPPPPTHPPPRRAAGGGGGGVNKD
jgi:hypothetical protein